MSDYDIPKSSLTALIRLIETLGVVVTEDSNEPEGARFIGTFTGNRLTLFPKYDSNFALYFTVAHLYGHMVQMVRQSAKTAKANKLLEGILNAPADRPRKVFTNDEVQTIYDHEYEAAAIGRRLICDLGPMTGEHDAQYARFLLADFHYLIHVFETGNGGPEVFAGFLRREPKPVRYVAADERDPVDVGHLEPTHARKVVVV